jgi:hypothetical protein
MIYDYYAYKYNLIFATASGNNDTRVTIFGDAYNGITTGGLILDTNNIYHQVGTLSNPGFTADNRQKPELTAPSQGQWAPNNGDTSWSNVPGIAATLLDYADGSGDADRTRSEVIKAVIINSAFPNIINKTGGTTTGAVWDTDRGYGRLDAFRAFETLSAPRLVPGTTNTNPKGWGFESLSAGQQDTYTIGANANERLLVTVTWHRRVVWTDTKTGFPRRFNNLIDDGELDAFLANLNLEVRDPDGILVSPAASTIDNLEKCDLLLTKSGEYDIKVVNQSGSESADYAIAFERLQPLTADFNIDYVVNDLDLINFMPYWLNVNCNNPTQPCFDYNLSVTDSIDLSDFSIFAAQWLTYDNRYYGP